jgi:hypothetical protein
LLLVIFVIFLVADLVFTKEQEQLLQDEIAELDDAISVQLFVIDANTLDVIGTASIELWVMIEDSINLLREVCAFVSLVMFIVLA